MSVKNTEIDRDFTFNELYHAAQKNYLVIVVSTLFFLSLSFFYLFIVLPVFSSTGKIFLDDEKDKRNPIMELTMVNNKNFIENEIEFLNSRTIAELTIDQLSQSAFKDSLYILKTKNENYDLSLPKQSLRKLLFLERKHYDNINSVPDSLKNEIVKEFRENISIININNTNILLISYQSPNPNESSLIVNTLINVYQNKDKEWENDELIYLQKFLEDQINIKKIELSKIEEKLKNFQESKKVFGLDSTGEIILNQLKLIEAEYYTNKAEIEIIQQRKKFFESTLSDQEINLSDKLNNTINSQLTYLRSELAILESEYISTKSKNDGNINALGSLENKISGIKKTIEDETNTLIKKEYSISNPLEYRQNLIDELILLKSQETNLLTKNKEFLKTIRVYEKQLESLPSIYLQLSRLERDKIILDETYALMKQKLEEAKISEASQLGKVRIIDYAIPENERVSPVIGTTILLFLIAGFTIGIFIVGLREYLNNTVRSIEEIEDKNIPILGIIPSFDTKDDNERRLLLFENKKSPLSESFRSIRTSLSFSRNNEQSLTILSTSTGPGEGKSTINSNLASTYALLGKKTILVDADMRKPVLHKLFELEKRGLTNYFSSQDKTDDIMKYVQQTNQSENLYLLTSGPIPPNPSEIIGSEKMKKLIEILKKEFDVIIFDTPPIIAVTDASVLSGLVDCFVLVIRAGTTNKSALNRALIGLKNIGTKITGAIINEASEQTLYGGGYAYQYYKQYYAQEEENN
tara:strand:- start:11351 stop:13609 length:2259 start_codon:yes stop_codon:yes gene_type:complete